MSYFNRNQSLPISTTRAEQTQAFHWWDFFVVMVVIPLPCWNFIIDQFKFPQILFCSNRQTTKSYSWISDKIPLQNKPSIPCGYHISNLKQVHKIYRGVSCATHQPLIEYSISPLRGVSLVNILVSLQLPLDEDLTNWIMFKHSIRFHPIKTV